MAVFSAAHPGSMPRRHGSKHWGVAGTILFLVMLAFVILSQLSQSGPVSCTGPSCPAPPPSSSPLSAPDHYTSSRYGFSLNYSPAIPPNQTTATSVSWDGTLNDGSEVTWTFLGGRVPGKGPAQVVSQVQAANFPDAQYVYTIPGASLGFTRGYGNVYNVSVAPANGQALHYRLIVIAAIRGGLAVALVGLGPYQVSKPSNSSHPNPADTPLVSLGEFEETIDSVTWPGERPL